MSDTDLTEQIVRVIDEARWPEGLWAGGSSEPPEGSHDQIAAAIVEQIIPKVRAEALREVRDAWTVQGLDPVHHERMKSEMRRNWPVLAGALDRIEKEQDS
jgi:hypothetical protein